jgi:hypothetical protein
MADAEECPEINVGIGSTIFAELYCRFCVAEAEYLTQNISRRISHAEYLTQNISRTIFLGCAPIVFSQCFRGAKTQRRSIPRVFAREICSGVDHCGACSGAVVTMVALS